MLRVVVRIDVYFTCGNKYEGRIDVNGKFNVSIFISVYLELSLLFCGLIEGFVLFLFILDLLFDSLVDLTKPLGTSKNLSLGQLEACHVCYSNFVYLGKKELVSCFAFKVSWMVTRHSFTLFLSLFQKYLEVIGFHKKNRSSYKLQ